MFQYSPNCRQVLKVREVLDDLLTTIDLTPNLKPWQVIDVARNRLGTLSPLFTSEGNISILCSGNGLALAMLDGIAQGGGQVAQCIVVDPTDRKSVV